MDNGEIVLELMPILVTTSEAENWLIVLKNDVSIDVF